MCVLLVNEMFVLRLSDVVAGSENGGTRLWSIQTTACCHMYQNGK